MKPKIDEITSVTELTKSDFCSDYFDKMPVIIIGGAKDSKAFKKWSPDYFKSLFGTKNVDIRHSKSGVYNYHKGEVTRLILPFNEAVTYLSLNNSYYIQQASIVQNFPELVSDLEEPQWMEKKDFDKQVNLWFGGAGCVSPLHYDGSHNFLVQIMGRKEVTLFSPGDSKFLYPNINGEINLRQISLIDLEKPDIVKFPLFKEAHAFKVILNPGDILYMPLNWWHHVRSLDLSISVNYWWNRFSWSYLKNTIKLTASRSLSRFSNKK